MKAALDPFYWRFQILGWGLFCLLNQFYVLFVFDGGYGIFVVDSLMQWLMLVLASHWIGLWTDRQGWLRLAGGKLWIRALGICVLAGVACAIPTIALYSSSAWAMPARLRDVLELVQTTNIFLQVLALAVQFATKLMFWYLVVWMIHQQRVGASVAARQSALELELQSTQLENLRQQLKPHFLFNCLNSIRAMIHIDRDKSSEMVDELTHILRYTLQAPGERVALSEELKTVDSYLSLEKARLGRRLTVEKHIDAAALDFPVPPLLLQTLVENAIRHGISRLAEGGTLYLDVSCAAPGVKIVVRNNGDLNGSGTGFGVGLKNSRQRLRLLYGREDLLQVAHSSGHVVSTLLVPAQTDGLSAHG